MTPETSDERAGERRPQSGRGLRALLATATQGSREDEKATAAVLESTQEVARTTRRLEARLQELAEAHRHDPPRVETATLVFLLNEFAVMISQLEQLLREQQLTTTSAALADRVRELQAVTSRNAEVVKRVRIVRTTLVLAMMLAGVVGGATAILLDRLMR